MRLLDDLSRNCQNQFRLAKNSTTGDQTTTWTYGTTLTESDIARNELLCYKQLSPELEPPCLSVSVREKSIEPGDRGNPNVLLIPVFCALDTWMLLSNLLARL